ncbi:MAG: hypothetical protein MnENMB40S_02470 [Rhizobiaceae bacterium MnEN-MB40S]|nr:MAG: hypothetical protein MnENMB40S_02470 [Rhizobiaceae bacterium MnEN-MB40S]
MKMTSQKAMISGTVAENAKNIAAIEANTMDVAIEIGARRASCSMTAILTCISSIEFCKLIPNRDYEQCD